MIILLVGKSASGKDTYLHEFKKLNFIVWIIIVENMVEKYYFSFIGSHLYKKNQPEEFACCDPVERFIWCISQLTMCMMKMTIL